MSTICRLKERQEAKTTLVFQVYASETCCQNREWEVGRGTTWLRGEAFSKLSETQKPQSG